jgi:hypothetical protein
MTLFNDEFHIVIDQNIIEHHISCSESIDHLLASRVFARQFSYLLLRHIGIHSFAPQPIDLSFDSWWRRIDAATTGLSQKGFNSLLILGTWIIWNHRNRCVFMVTTPI